MLLQYSFDDEAKAGLADGRITIDADCRESKIAKLYWADSAGVLSDYMKIKELELNDGKATYQMKSGRNIPQTATKLICKMEEDTCETILEFKLPAAKLVKNEKPNYTFFLLTDIHGAGDYWQNKSNRDAAFADAASFSPTHIIISGDITNAGQAPQYEKVKEYVDAYFPQIPVFFTTGNHDHNTYVKDLSADLKALDDFFIWQTERNNRLGAKISDVTNCRYDTYFGDFHSIFLNASAPENKFGLGEDQRNWMEQKLCESDGNGLPAFVISHFPVKGKTGLVSLYDQQYFSDNDAVEELLNRHNCIYVSGHTHYNLDSDDPSVCVGKNAPSYINAGCAVWTQNGYDETGKDIYIPERCMGQCVEVYDKYLLIRGRDFTNRKFIPRCEFKIEF